MSITTHNSKRKETEKKVEWSPKIWFREERNCWVVDCGRRLKPRKTYFPQEDRAKAFAKVKADEWMKIQSDITATKRDETKTKAVVRVSEWSTSDRARIVAALEMAGTVDRL